MDRIDRIERGRVMSKSANNYSPLRNEVQGSRVAWKPIDEASRSYVENGPKNQYSFGRDNYMREQMREKENRERDNSYNNMMYQ